jgi:hypothetical protein
MRIKAVWAALNGFDNVANCIAPEYGQIIHRNHCFVPGQKFSIHINCFQCQKPFVKLKNTANYSKNHYLIYARCGHVSIGKLDICHKKLDTTYSIFIYHLATTYRRFRRKKCLYQISSGK